MNPGRFYVPNNIAFGNNVINSMIPTNHFTKAIGTSPRNIGLFGRITNGIRSVNWGNFLNNANKTLNVVNQTIPLVRQASPMFNNMKNMVKIVKAFGNETNHNRFRNNNNSTYNFNRKNIDVIDEQNSINNLETNNSVDINSNNINMIQKKEVKNDSIPNFFI